jgi:hypothetical protein
LSVGKHELWSDFVDANRVVADSVPLFATEQGRVKTVPYGRDGRPVLQRSPEMEALMRGLGNELVTEYHAGSIVHDGILYLMFRREDGDAIPLYVGKSEIFGKTGNLSANVADLPNGDAFFGRWGYGYAYHIGDLSAATLPGHATKKKTRKYEAWQRALFTQESDGITLNGDVRFWACLWHLGRQSIWREFGSTRLTFEEYLLIGVASDLFPDDVLNREGRNRTADEQAPGV